MAIATFEAAAELAVHQRDFDNFLEGLPVVVVHLAQAVALLTIAFAVGAGWFAGSAPSLLSA